MVALELRNEKDVKSLRSSFNELDNKVNNGNIGELKIAIEQIKELSEDVLRPRIKKERKICDVTVD